MMECVAPSLTPLSACICVYLLLNVFRSRHPENLHALNLVLHCIDQVAVYHEKRGRSPFSVLQLYSSVLQDAREQGDQAWQENGCRRIRTDTLVLGGT